MNKKKIIQIALIILIFFANQSLSYSQRNLDSLFSLLKEAKDETEKIHILKDLAWQIRSSNPSRAFDYGVQSLYLAKKLKIDNEIACIYNYLGVIRRNQGNYTSALEYYFLALKIAENIEDKREIAYALNNIGGIYNRQKKNDKAIEYVKRAIEKFKELNDIKGIAYAYNQLSYINIEIGLYNLALNYCRRAYKIHKKRKAHLQIAVIFNTMGRIFEHKDKKDSAIYYYQKGLEFRKKYRDLNGQAQSFNSIGYFYNRYENYEIAIEYLNKSLKLGREINSARRIISSLSGLSIAYSELKDYEKAFQAHKEFKHINDSIINQESVKKITQLEMQYIFDKQLRLQELEIEKKDLSQQQQNKQMKIRRNIYLVFSVLVLIATIIALYAFRSKNKANNLLAEKKKQIENQRDRLQIVNATKDKFFSIIAHDLKNPFTSIIGFSELLIKQYSRFSDEQKIDFIKSINSTSRQTHKLLVNLLQWARAQTGNIKFEPEVVDFSEIAKENLLLQKESAKKKKINIYAEVRDNLMVYVDKNMINTALRNITSNAIKFTNEDGEIKIRAVDMGEFIEVSVEDTGIGIEDKDMKKLFRIDEFYTTKGTNHETGTGLGLVLSKEFVEKNGGNIIVKSQPGKGTKFFFTLPKANPDLEPKN
jgi:signal transduction histidine kinase